MVNELKKINADTKKRQLMEDCEKITDMNGITSPRCGFLCTESFFGRVER